MQNPKVGIEVRNLVISLLKGVINPAPLTPRANPRIYNRTIFTG